MSIPEEKSEKTDFVFKNLGGRRMGKIIRWIQAVIAGNQMYAPMAGVDIKKSADKLFEKKSEKEDEKTKKSPENAERDQD